MVSPGRSARNTLKLQHVCIFIVILETGCPLTIMTTQMKDARCVPAPHGTYVHAVRVFCSEQYVLVFSSQLVWAHHSK